MIPVISKQTMRALDAHMIQNEHIPSLLLMENAAFGITTAIAGRFDTDTRIVAVCGAGNNGGDGFAAARQLRAKGYNISPYLIGKRENLKGDAAVNAAFFDDITEIADETQAKAHFADLCGCVVIDAIFGIGLSRNVEGLFAAVIDLINNSGAYIVGCDIPSGIDSNSGQVLGTAVRANETITFQCAKPGLLLYPGRQYTGCLTVKEIGTPGYFDLGNMRAVTGDFTLPRRSPDTHKSTYGRLACVVGSQGMSGAGLMCVGGALRAGAGLTTAGVPSCLQDIFSAHTPECMTFALSDFGGSLREDCIDGLNKLMNGKKALAAGCGLSVGPGTTYAVRHMVTSYDIQKVFDADALNVIAQDTGILLQKQGDIVLTPHIVEFSRLSGLSPDDIRQDPITSAQGFAAKYGVVLLLKGATTIVTDGKRTMLVLAGTPGMAKGGSGDVLTGVIGGLLAGSRATDLDTFDAAVYGAYICGKAGEAAAETHGEYAMTATDTLAHIGTVIKAMTV